ncbi:gp80 [Brochothrix phage A9]|uniref:Gp80 n=1 Tax=Brochothrix phage A9 TaxID=857312 RepID=D9J0M7_9CAUD|nr:gp80 [Brochothrix phage A9]ADJ53120.1 gp80 [Brochothrix phage A9]
MSLNASMCLLINVPITVLVYLAIIFNYYLKISILVIIIKYNSY